MHPADRLVLMMNRIYCNGLTTTSGGNLSVRDESGDVWITPSGIDKGSLTRADMCRVKPGGMVLGPHKPSVELPFHLSVYRERPDLNAVLHAHPPALVAFSISRVIPDINLVAETKHICGDVTMAAYAVPGSQKLGENISAEFKKGFDIVMLANHGVVVGATDIFQAFMKFETLETAAKTEILARRLGRIASLSEAEMKLAQAAERLEMDEFTPEYHSAEEREARRNMVALIHRAYRQRLIISTRGDYSVRLDSGDILITPHGADRAYMEDSDLVLIRRGMAERGKVPSRAVAVHQAIYERNPEIRSVLGASPPHIMAFAVTAEAFDPRTIPESYILLRDIEKVPLWDFYEKLDEAAARFSSRKPVFICRNREVLATGDSMLSAFDRLEVTEATARSIIYTGAISDIVHISDKEIADIDEAFRLK